jgi:DNA adenine methylase
MESSLIPVAPTRPIAPYLGGKRNMAKRLCALIEATPHDFYGEPFVGMAGVFLRRSSKPPAEAINDLNREVYNLFRVLQVHYVHFMEMLRLQLTMRAEFERLTAVDPATLTDMQRAARFLYLQRLAFGGKPTSQHFGVTRSGPARFDVTRLQPMLEELHERLAGVRIECLPYGDFIRRYDRPGALFFIDPPYVGGEEDYGKGMFSRADYEALSDLLERLQGRFILTLNDVPLVRETFGRFKFEELTHTYRVSGAVTPAKEVIIKGGG